MQQQRIAVAPRERTPWPPNDTEESEAHKLLREQETRRRSREAQLRDQEAFRAMLQAPRRCWRIVNRPKAESGTSRAPRTVPLV